VKHHLILEYNINLAFLVLLKAEGRAIHDHPVIRTLPRDWICCDH
jgi:hypothetical protein